MLFDAGHVSAAPQLIYHSNCEWQTGTEEQLRKAAPNPPFSHFILNYLCQGWSLSGEWRPCVLRLQMGKNNTAHTDCPLGDAVKGCEDILIPTSVFE